MMADELKLYKISISGDGAAAATSLQSLSAALGRAPAGRYRIDQVQQRPGFLSSVVTQWGWGVKREDGTIHFEPMDEPGRYI